jgi:hypothetical protein
MAAEYTKQRQTRASGVGDNIQDTEKNANFKQHPKDIGIKIIDAMTSPAFTFPLRQETLESEGTITYLYQNGAVYPKLYEFLGEVLHTSIPILINDVKFGPGEIIVKESTSAQKSEAGREEDQEKERRDTEEANAKLLSAIKELQKLIHGRKSKISS